MTRIIVTDITAFSNNTKVCIAGIQQETGQCIRPMPYLEEENCRNLDIFPGTILEGKFAATHSITAPHSEDLWHRGLAPVGQLSNSDFRNVLLSSCSGSVQDGFGHPLGGNEKSYCAQNPPAVSLITISIPAKTLCFRMDKYRAGRAKVSFCDRAGFLGQWYNFLPVADLGIRDFLSSGEINTQCDILNAFFHSQTEVVLRIGLGRIHEEKYWMQVNGFYSFPTYCPYVRRATGY